MSRVRVRVRARVRMSLSVRIRVLRFGVSVRVIIGVRGSDQNLGL